MVNPIDQEFETLDGMVGLLPIRESAAFRDQIDRIKEAMLALLTDLTKEHEKLRKTVAEAIQDVKMEVAATEHDLESTRRERDALKRHMN